MLAENSVLTLTSLYRSIKLQVVHKFLSNFTFYTEALPIIAQLHIPRNNLYLEMGRPLLPNWVAISNSVAIYALLAVAGTEATMSLQAWGLAWDYLCLLPLPQSWEAACPSKLEGSGLQWLLSHSLAMDLGQVTQPSRFFKKYSQRMGIKIPFQRSEGHRKVT